MVVSTCCSAADGTRRLTFGSVCSYECHGQSDDGRHTLASFASVDLAVSRTAVANMGHTEPETSVFGWAHHKCRYLLPQKHWSPIKHPAMYAQTGQVKALSGM